MARRVDHFMLPFEKGPVLRLAPHTSSCGTIDELLEFVPNVEAPLAADLFCGAGGFSLGLEEAGFTSVVGVDFDDQALETYRSLFPGLALKRDLSDAAAITEVSDLLTAVGVTAIVGGPPCQPFSRAGRSTIRSLVDRGFRDAHDGRRDLWQSFLEIVERVQPRIVMIENVPDLGLGDESRILRIIIERLETDGYGVDARLIDAWKHGVPQYRQRLFIVGIAHGRQFHWPAEASYQTTVDNAIGDLPPIAGGWNEAGGIDGYLAYMGPQTDFQLRARKGVPPSDRHRVYDHITRAVREDDRQAFALMDHTTSYADLSGELKRYRDDIFDDRYKRLNGDDIGRTIIAHLAKDGYGFIHPTQDRTLSIREAARLQTFPDRVRFAGSPTASLRQIGNAVPPLLGEQLGVAALASLAGETQTAHRTATAAESLASWYVDRGAVTQPWLAEQSTWPVLVGEMFLFRADRLVVNSVWPIVKAWRTPSETLEMSDKVRAIAALLGKEEAATLLLEAACRSASDPNTLHELRSFGVPESQSRLIALASPTSDEDVMFSDRGVLRVVGRFFGSRVHRENQRSAGRVETAKLVGAGDHERLSNLALVELARAICVPEQPRCSECPLQDRCVEAAGSERGIQAKML